MSTSESPSSGDKKPNENHNSGRQEEKHQNDLVTFIVGPPDNTTTFPLNKALVTCYSDVLRKHFKALALAGQPPIFRLPDILPGTIKHFSQWLSTQTLDLTELQPDIKTEPANATSAISTQDLQLVQLWVLAGKWAIPRIQNHVMRAIFQTGGLDAAVFGYVYEHTMTDSALRRFVVDYAAFEMGADVVRVAVMAGEIPGQLQRDGIERIEERLPVLRENKKRDELGSQGQGDMFDTDYFVSEELGDAEESDVE